MVGGREGDDLMGDEFYCSERFESLNGQMLCNRDGMVCDPDECLAVGKCEENED